MGKIICKKCGTENEETNKICSQCGNVVKTNNLTKKFNKKVLIPIFAVVVVIAIAVWASLQPKTDGIRASYDGETKEGTVLDENNQGIKVIAYKEDGKEVELKNWKIDKPSALKADEFQVVKITYKDFYYDLLVNCSTSKVESIEAEYNGATEAGTVIDSSCSDIYVSEIYKNGKEEVNNTDWKVVKPVTLVADKISDVEIECNAFSTTISVECSTHELDSISASYDGDTEEGTVLDTSNSGITVKAKYKNGDKKNITDFTIKKSKTLIAGETSKISISYQDKKCSLKVTCTTLSEAQYKEQCQSISYSDLARDPDSYDGTDICFTGKVVQVMEDYGVTSIRVNVTPTSYGGYDDTVFLNYIPQEGENRILEDDIITFYGTYSGLYTYTSIMGASITIPEVSGKYVVLT